MNILAFAASNSKYSINRTLAAYAAGRIDIEGDILVGVLGLQEKKLRANQHRRIFDEILSVASVDLSSFLRVIVYF